MDSIFKYRYHISSAFCSLLFTGLLLASLSGFAQQRPPVNATTIMGLPYTPFISDYYAANSSNLQVNLLFNDLTEPSLDVYLHLKINSSKVKFESKANFKPTQAINLLPGQLKNISGSDLSTYFDYNNLDITGTTVADLQRTGMFPEGNYNFCIEVREYNSGRTVSNISCAFAVIQLQEPPLVLSPKEGSTEIPKSPQNISFQWQLRTIPPGGYSNVEYIVKLYEITDPKVQPKTAVLNNQALKIYESPIAVQYSTFIYDVSATLLSVGKRYAFTVQAKDKQNRATFKNDGVSEISWFRYGTSTDGNIELKKPEDQGGFTSKENVAFSWSAPDNLESNMSFKYHMKIVKLEGKTPKDAISKNQTFYEYTSTETTSTQDAIHTPSQKLAKMEEYAWQVTASFNGIKIAESKVQSFTGPPLMDYFIAGNQQVQVIKTYNKDLNKLSGRGKIPYANDGLLFEFKDIQLKRSGSDYVLAAGEIKAPFVNKPDPIEIKPEYKDNGSAYFQPDTVRLTSQKYYLGGKVTWDLPHAIKGGSKGVVTSQYTYLVYSDKKLIGSAPLDATNDYELMDPLNFRLNLFKDQSDFLISSNVFRFRLYGEIYVPQNVKSVDQKRIAFEFDDKRDVFYFDMSTKIIRNNELPLVSKANVYAVPKKWILDLSETTSPPRFSSNKSWKGLYYEDFNVEYYTDVDASKQLIFNQKLAHTYNLSKDNGLKMWIDAKGLQAKVHRAIAATEDAKFNQFPATLADLNIDVENSVTKAKVTGTVRIPFISEDKQFEFTIPINDDGFQTGSFDKTLDGYKLVFNPDGGDQLMNVTIKRAVFADNERLDCTIDLEIPKLKVTFSSINNFRIYGDMFIGYSKRNGSYNLPNHKVGKFDTWTINIDKLGAGLIKGNYALSYSGSMPLGKDVSGKTGPPRIDISSTIGVKNAVEGVDLSAGDYGNSKTDIPVNIKSDKKKDQFAFEPMEVKFSSAIVAVNGYLEVRQDDPVWGTCFKGGLNGSLLVPSKIDMGANMILGTTNDQMKYWYFDAYFNDTEGQGVKVFNFFNIVALEGRVYRHMKQNIKTKEFEINKDVEFGAGIYTQLIDPANAGKLFKSDIAAEIEVVKGDFTVQVEGDIAVFNATARSAGAGAALKKKAAQEMAKEAAKQAAKQIGEINVTVPISSDKLKLRGSSTIAGMTYVSGGTEVGFLGDISSTPKATVFYKNGGDEISMSGSTSGAADFTLKKGSDKFTLDYDGSKSGSFSLALSDFSMGAAFDNTQKSGSLSLGYDSKKMKLTGNKTTGEGSLLLKYDAKKQFYASLSSAGKGAFSVMYDDFNVYLAGDKSTGSGSIGLRISNDSLFAKVDKSKSEGQLYTNIGGYIVDSYANTDGGKIYLQKNSAKFSLEANRTAGSGKLLLEPSATEKYSVELKKSGKGKLLVQNSSLTLKLDADKTAGSGNFFLNTSGVTLRGGADKTAGTGYAGYRNGSDSILVAIPSSTELQLNSNFSSNSLSFYLNKSGQGNAMFKNSSIALYAGANKSAKSGYFGFKNNSDSLYTLVDGSQSKGIFYLALGSKLVNAEATAGSGTLKLKDGSKEFNLAANISEGTGSLELIPTTNERYYLALSKAGTGNLEIKRSGFELRLQGAKSAGSGDFYLDTQGKIFRGGADKTAGTGYAGYKNGSDSIFVALPSSTELVLNSNFSNNSINFNINKSGQGSAVFKNSSIALYAGANKSAKSGYFGFKNNSDSLYTLVDGSQSKGIFYLALGSKLVNAEATAGNGTMKLKDGSKEFNLAANISEGTGSLELIPTTNERYYLALSKAGTGNLEIKRSGFELRLQGAKSAGSGDFYLDTQGKIFRGGADKSGGTGYASYRNGSDSVFTSIESSGLKIASAFSGVSLGLEATKAGSGKFLYKNGADFVSLNGDVTAKTGSFAVGASGKNFYLNGDVNNLSGTFGFKSGSDSVYAAMSSTAAKYYFNTSSFLIDVAGNISGEATLKINSGGKELEIDGDVVNNDGKIKYTESGLALEVNSVTKEFNFTSGSTTLKAKVGSSIELYENNTQVTLNFSNGQGTFNGTYNGKSVEFTVNNSEKYLKVSDGSNYSEVSFDNSYNGSAEFKYNGNLYKAEKDASGNYLVQYNTKYAKLKSDKSFELADGTSRTISMSKDNLDVSFDGYDLELDGTAKKLSYKHSGQEAYVSSTELYLKDGQKSLKLNSDKKIEYANGTSQLFKASSDGLDVKYDSYVASYSSSKSLSFSDGTRTMAFAGSKMELTDGSNKLAVEASETNPSIELTSGSNSMKVNKQEATLVVGTNSLKLVKDNKLEVKYDKYTLDVSKDKANYSDGTYSVNLGGDNLLKLSENSKSFTVTNDQSVQYKDGTTTDISISKTGLDFKYDSYVASYSSSKSLSFSDGTRTMAFAGSKMELTDGSNKLAVEASETNPSIELTSGSNSMKVNKQEATLVVGTNSLKLVKDNKLEVKYDKYTLDVSKDKANYSDGTYSVNLGGDNLLKLSENSKSFTVTNDQSVQYKDGTTTDISISKTGLDFKYDSYVASYSSSKSLSFSDGTRTMAFAGSKMELTDGANKLAVEASETNPSIELISGSNTLKVNKQEASLMVGNNTLKFVKDNKLEVKYDKYTLDVSKDKANYSDGTYTVNLGGDQLLKLSDASKSFVVTNDQSVQFKDGTTTDITVSKTGLDFKYDKYKAGFSTSKSLNFSDGTRSFAFEGNKVELSESTNKLTLITDAANPSIQLTDGSNTLKMSKQEAELIYGQNSLKINKDAKLAVTYDGHTLNVDKEQASYSKGNLKAAIGGSNIISVSEGTRSLSFDKQYNLAVKDGKYEAKIGSNKTFMATDGSHKITMGGDDLIAYSKSDLKLALFKGTIGYGVRSEYQSYKIAVEAGKGKSAKVEMEEASMGKLNFSGSSGGDLTVGYVKGSSDLYVDAGKKSFKVYGTMADDIKKSMMGGAGGTAKDPSYIGGAAPPSMSGPKYLGDKITKGEGAIKGKVSMYYSSGKEHLLVNGAVSGAKPICVKGAFMIESKKSNWKVMIGEKTKLIEIYPTCTGFGGEGYFYYDSKKIEFFVKAGYRFDQRVGPSWGNIRAEAHANISVGAAAELSPFKLLEAEIGFSLGAKLTVNYDFKIFSGSFEVASASLKGNLKADFQKSTLSGKLDGHVRVCGFGKGFTYNFTSTI